MTKIRPVTVKCGVCGKLVEEYEYLSLYIGNSSSIDGFNEEYPEPTVCTHCGYISYDISKPALALLELVNSPDYRKCKYVHVDDNEMNSEDNDDYKTYLRESNRRHIRVWYQYYLIMQVCNDLNGAYYALRNMLHYLDEKDYEECLPDAYDMFLAIFDTNKEEDYIIKLDYLRRLKRFDEAAAMYDSVNWDSFSLQTVIMANWEKQLIDSQDSRIYSYKDIIGLD